MKLKGALLVQVGLLRESAAKQDSGQRSWHPAFIQRLSGFSNHLDWLHLIW